MFGTLGSQFGALGSSASLGPVIPYSGPGDVVTGATAWWGLRGYNRAVSNGVTKSVNLRRSFDNATSDFVILGNGALDVGSITAFANLQYAAENATDIYVAENGTDAYTPEVTPSSLFVATLYDQASTHNMTQATAANQPSFTLNGLGALPIMSFAATGPQSLTLAVGLPINQPFTHDWVAQRTGATTVNGDVIGSASTTPQSGFANTSGNVFMYAGTIQNIAALEGNYHAVMAVFNGASSNLNVDGTANTVSAGAGNIDSPIIGTGNSPLTGNVVEVGVWSSALTPANGTSLSTNQHTYWGF